jgi:hypothetical protein
MASSPNPTTLCRVHGGRDTRECNTLRYSRARARLCVAHVGLDCASPTFGLDFASSRSLRLSVDFVTTLTIRSASSFPLHLYPFWHYAAYFYYLALFQPIHITGTMQPPYHGVLCNPSYHHGHYVAPFLYFRDYATCC